MPQQYIEIVLNATMAANGGQSKNIANIFHFRRTSTLNPFNKANVESQFQTIVVAPLLLATQQDYTQTGTSVRCFDDATDPPQMFTETGVGAIATDRAPDYQTVVIQSKSALKGRSYRGSKHFAGVAEASTTGDILNGGGVTLWQAVADAWFNGFTDSDGNIWIPIIKSNKPPAQYTTNPVTVVSNDVVSVLVNKSLGIMKRRKIRTVN